METNIDNWHEFEIGQLFEVINSKPYHKGDVIEADEEAPNSVNYITRSKFNNGLLYKVEDSNDFDKNPKNTISFGAENADFFIQLEEYITGNKMYYIDTQELTLNQSLFFKTVLQKTLTNKYGFNDGLTGEKLRAEKILLPAIYNNEKEEYEPDWEYMEEFIKNAKEENEKKLATLNTLFNPDNTLVNGGGYNLDISDWREFRIGDYFKSSLGALISNKELSKFGEYPVVTGITENNGVNGYTDKLFKDYLFSNILTISNRGEYSGTVYYHNYKFILGSNVIALKPIDFELSEKIGLFLSTSINKLPYGGYDTYPTKNSIEDDIIKLPAIYNYEKEKYEPDWEYMENFITILQEDIKDQLRRLKQKDE